MVGKIEVSKRNKIKMAIRKQYTISLTDQEKERIDKVCDQYGEQFSAFIRRQILIIVSEEEGQK